jgi:hypothetical protein
MSTISFDIFSVILELNRSSFVFDPSTFWGNYIQHNATKSLLNYLNILQNLKEVKGEAIEYAKYLVRSMLGFLYYAKYTESSKTDMLRATRFPS